MMNKMLLVTILVGLIAGLVGLYSAAVTETAGWSMPGLAYIVFWIPLLSIFCAVDLAYLLRSNRLRPAMVLSIVVWTGLIQWALLESSASSRLPLFVMPVLLTGLSILSLAIYFKCNINCIGPGTDRLALILATLALITFGSLQGYRFWQRSIAKANQEQVRVEDDRKNRTLRGIHRAAWMLAKVFYMSDFSEQRFLESGQATIGHFGEFVWDPSSNVLRIREKIFQDDSIRRLLLPHAQKAIEHPLLRTGKRADLDDGELTVVPPLDGYVEWLVDVDSMDYDTETSRKLIHATGYIAIRLLNDIVTQKFPETLERP